MKMTCPLTVILLEAWLAPLQPDMVLFDLKPSAFRGLHDRIARHFGLSIVDGIGLTPSSHRGGGATALFERCQSLDMVRWAGRWSTQSRTMEIYVQEVAAASALPSLSATQRELVSIFARVAHALPLRLLQKFRAA